MVLVRQIRPELIGVVSDRAEVVVDHIQHHGQILHVAGVNKTFEGIRATVWLKHGEEKHTVITPTATTGELIDRHQFHMGHAELNQMVQVRDRTIKSAVLAERTDVEFIDNTA